MSKVSRSSGRPVRKCMWQRTVQRNFSARLEALEFIVGKQTRSDQVALAFNLIEIFADPEQRVQVAQSALAVLDIGLHQITRCAGFLVALITLAPAWRQ